MPPLLARVLARLTWLTALVVAVVMLVAFVAYKQSQVPLVSLCGGKSKVGQAAGLLVAGANVGRAVGEFVENVNAHPDAYASPSAIRENMDGTMSVIDVWWRSFADGVQSKPRDPLIDRLIDAAKREAQLSVRGCLPCGLSKQDPPNDPATPQDQQQQGGGSASNSITSTALASDESEVAAGSPRDRVRQAASRFWSGNDLAMAVAIAGAESTFRPSATLNYRGMRMLGAWQINEAAHGQLVAAHQPWSDLNQNAAMAHQIWLDAGRSWLPWSTFTSGAYRSFMSADDQESSDVQSDGQADLRLPFRIPGCPGHSNMGPRGSIGQWNARGATPDSAGSGVAQMVQRDAEVIALTNSTVTLNRGATGAVQSRGWSVVAGTSAVPIFYSPKRYDLLRSGYANSADGHPVSWAQLQEKDTASVFAVVNSATPADPVVRARAADFSAGGDSVIITGGSRQDVKVGAKLREQGYADFVSVLGRQFAGEDPQFSIGATPVATRKLDARGGAHRPVVVTYRSTTPNVVDASGSVAGVGGERVVRDPASGIDYTVRMPTDPRRVKAMEFAFAQLGKPYVFGSQGPNTWDCSSLMHGAWGAAGVDVYPQTETLVRQFVHVSSPQPGDMLYHPGHVQMFLGTQGGKTIILEAPRTGLTVRIVPQWGTTTAVLDPTRPTS